MSDLADRGDAPDLQDQESVRNDIVAGLPAGDDESLVDATGNSSQHGASGDVQASLRGLMTYLVDNLVDQPETAEIDLDQRGSLVQIQLRLPEEEIGKVIGRGGRIAKAMRTALMVAGSRHHVRVSLDIESQG